MVGLLLVVAPPGSIALLIVPNRALRSTMPDRLRGMFGQLPGNLLVWEWSLGHRPGQGESQRGVMVCMVEHIGQDGFWRWPECMRTAGRLVCGE